MRSRRPDRHRPQKPVVWGIGLIALDLIIEKDITEPRVAAGGTCANVMAILSQLGWTSLPIGRLADDAASVLVISDLQRWGVNVDAIRIRPAARTPIIVERVKKDADGIPFHTFSFSCPECGRRHPGFQAVTTTSLIDKVGQMEKPDVVFIDRVSRSAIMLAEKASKKGAIVFFEPCGVSNDKQFAEMLALSHIVKYSHDRLLHVGELEWRSQMLLEIQTLGRGGLRFRTAMDSSSRRWRSLEALKVEQLKDTAGCGDWLSSGLIHKLCRGGLIQLKRAPFDRLVSALDFGQRLAAWNCGFVGARGGMNTISPTQFRDLISRIQVGRKVVVTTESAAPDELLKYTSVICDDCAPRDPNKKLEFEVGFTNLHLN
jgi:sugar/nucleoside kinase (ribokinase family)